VDLLFVVVFTSPIFEILNFNWWRLPRAGHYGHLFEGSDCDSAEKMEELFGGELKVGRVLTMPDRGGVPNRLADKTADKNTKDRFARASK